MAGNFVDVTDPMFLLTVPALLYIVYWLAYGRFKGPQSKKLSGPSITPFLGDLADFSNHKYQLHSLLDAYYKKYAPLFTFNHKGNEIVVVSDENIIKQILIKQFAKFPNRKFFVDLPWPCHEMITMLKDPKSMYVRSLLTPAFTPSSLKEMTSLMSKAADTYMEKIKEAAEKEESFDVANHSQGFVMETLLSISFSIDCPNQSDFNKTLIQLVQNFTRPPWWVHVVAALPFGQHLAKYIPGAFKKQLQPFIDTANGIVYKRHEDKGQYQDILGALLGVQKAGADTNGNILQDEDILAQGIVILTAVHVATSTTLAVTSYYIAKHKDIQKKIQKEIDAIGELEGFPTWDHVISDLPYLEQVIQEGLRLYPSAYMVMRECTEACTVENITFDKGDTVVIPTYSIHRDQNLWSNPNSFDPDRFSAENKNNLNNYHPFGDGPRACLGNRMAMVEMKLMLAKMLRKYDLYLESHQPIDIRSDSTVQAMMSIHTPIMLKGKERIPPSLTS